jgi:HlyD family secretion protein
VRHGRGASPARSIRPRGSGGRRPAVLATAVTAVLLAAMVCGCGRAEKERGSARGQATPSRVVGLGRIEPQSRVLDLTCEVAGTVRAIRVPPGGRAEAGETILELARDVEAAGLAQAVAAVHVRRAGVVGAEAALLAARATAGEARRNHARAVALFETQSVSQEALEAAATRLESADQQARRLEAEVASARALVEQARADSARAFAEYRRRALDAPAPGQILSLDVTLGSVVSPQRPLGTFAPDGPIVARCEIDELFSAMVKVGQPAYVRRQGSTDTLAVGRVSFVGPALLRKSLLSDEVGDLEDRRVRETHILLDDQDGLLPGTRVECVIDVD